MTPEDPLAITGHEAPGEIPAPRLPALMVSTDGGRLTVSVGGRDVTGSVESITAALVDNGPPRVHMQFREAGAEFFALAAEGADITTGDARQLVREYLEGLDMAALEDEVANRSADAGLGALVSALVVSAILDGLNDGDV